MRRDDGRHAPVAQMRQQRPRQRRAFGRVRARAHLVQQDQRATVRHGQDVDGVGHVRREGAQRLFDALLVADVGVNAAEDAQTGVVRRQMQAALGHQRHQTGGLQAHGLAAGVGPGDDQHPGVGVKNEIDRDDRAAQQGVARALHVYDAARRPVCRTEGHEDRLAGGHLLRVTRARQHQVQLGQHLHRAHDGLGFLADLGAQRRQNASDFLFLFQLQLAPGVVQFDRRQGLDEQGRAAGRRIVHDARNAALEAGLERDDVTPAARGDQRFLQKGAVLAAGDDALQARDQAFVRQLEVPAQNRQARAGVVAYVAVFRQRGADGDLQLAAFLRLVDDLGQQGVLRAQAADAAAQGRGAAQGLADIQQGRRVAVDAARRQQGRVAHVARAAQRQLALLQQDARLDGLPLPLRGLVEVAGRHLLARQLRAGGEGTVFRQLLQHLVQFQRLQRLRVHRPDPMVSPRQYTFALREIQRPRPRPCPC